MTNDLVLLQNDSTLSIRYVGSLAALPKDLGAIGLLSFRYVSHCCEWLEALGDCDSLAGFAFVDFTDTGLSSVIGRMGFLNVQRTADGLLVLFEDTSNPRIQPGPYLPVYHYRNDMGCNAFLIPQAIPNELLNKWRNRVIIHSEEC